MTVGGIDMTAYLNAAGNSKFMGSTGQTNIAFFVSTATQCDVVLKNVRAL